MTLFTAPDADAECDVCGRSFAPKGDWQRTCTPCWVAEKEEKIRAEGYRAGYRAGAASVAGNGRMQAGMDAAFVMELIELSHPDRQPAERWEQSNRVTARLLDMLKRLRKGAA